MAWAGVLAIALSVPVIAGVYLTSIVFDRSPAYKQVTLDNIAFIDSLEPDSRLTVVSPFYVGLDWAYVRWPARWAFVPANRESLDLLNRRYPVGTIAVPDNTAYLGTEEFLRTGFSLVDERPYKGARYRIFKRT